MPSRQLAAVPRAGTPADPSTTNRVRRRDVPVWLSLTALALGGFGIGTTEFATHGRPARRGRRPRRHDPRGRARRSRRTPSASSSARRCLAVLGARLPRKALLLALMAAFTVANALSALAPTLRDAGRSAVRQWPAARRVLRHRRAAGRLAVPADRRARAVARVMLGLTVANVVGVPLATLLGQQLGWRSTYAAVAVIGVLAWRRRPLRPAVPAA